MSTLSDLIEARLQELGISLRTAAARSQGLTTASTLSRLVSGHHTGKISARTLLGIAIGLDLPREAVHAAAAASTAPLRWVEVSTAAGEKLPPETLDKIMAVLEQELADYEAAQARRVREARPFG